MLINFRTSAGTNIPVDNTTNPLPVNVVTAGSASTKCTFVRGYKVPAATATPEAIAAAGTYVTTVTIWGIKAARTNNTGSVWVDSLSTNDLQAIEVPSGTPVVFTAPPGKVIDLGELYVDSVTAADGVYYFGML